MWILLIKLIATLYNSKADKEYKLSYKAATKNYVSLPN